MSRASRHYRRLLDKCNPYWMAPDIDNPDWRRNAIFVQTIQESLNDLLRIRGYVSLNEALELLGFERTIRGGQAGWIRDAEEGDGFIDFGIWNRGFAEGRDWVRGKVDAKMLYFNVDPVEISMPRRIAKLKEEGKI